MESLKGTSNKTPPEEVVRYVNVTKTLNLRVDSFENIDDIKDKFSEFEGIETNLQKTFFTKGGFENDQVLDFERKDGSTVHMNLHFGVRLQVNIKVSWRGDTTDDKLILLDVYSWDTIGDVKSKFQDKMAGTPANRWTLNYGENQLDDSQTLASYAIENDSVLHAVFLGEADTRKLTFSRVIFWNKRKHKRKQMRSVLHTTKRWKMNRDYEEVALADIEMGPPKGTQTPPDQEVRYVSVTKTLNLRVNSFEKIDDVNNKFSEFEGTETNLQKTFFTKGGFENDQVLDFERKDGSSVHMNLHLGVKLQVNIKVSWGATTTDEKLISLDVYSWDTIADVKTKFQHKEGTPANDLTFFYDGKQLEDLQTLVGYDIGNHSTLDALSLGVDKIVISVRTSSKDPIEVMVKLRSTVENLKRIIHDMVNFAVDRQELTFNGVVLENGQRLSDYNIQMGSELQLDFTRRTNGIQIFVRNLTGKTRTICVNRFDTIGTLKTEIKYVELTPECNQRLIFNGKQLEDGHTLGYYNIQKDSTIHLVVGHCGC